MNNKCKDFKPASKKEVLNNKELSILDKNKKFFSADSKYVKIMLEIINGESAISIRLLDWFVSNYSKKWNTFYKIKIHSKIQLFYVHSEYKNQLHGYSKRYFDPFCRKNSKKIIYRYSENNKNNNKNKKPITFLTSIGQLNFFQWAIRYKIIKYVQLHIKQIENDMKEVNKLSKERKKIMKELVLENDGDESDEIDSCPDPNICSDGKINSFRITSQSSDKMNVKTSSDKKNKRQQLSVSMLDTGIKKYNIPVSLDFE
jgi:hypothetical protein